VSKLTITDIRTYNEEGYLTPIDVMSSKEAEKFCANYYRVQKENDADLTLILRSKAPSSLSMVV
jgi:hypothetical protein